MVILSVPLIPYTFDTDNVIILIVTRNEIEDDEE